MDTLQAETLEGKQTSISGEYLEAFSNQIRGEVITSGHEDYKDACTIYNAMIQKKPAIIARCHNAGDVISSVNFARENNLLLAIRSGGHNGPGLGTCEDGLVIDCSPMKGIHVNPEDKTVRAEPGNTWGDVDHATNAFGLATVSGIIGTTGIGGLTLGGGHGYLSRKHGLTIDNLLEADVVLADGSFVTASEKQNSDLFWALRGGGGNFGVVTSFKYKLHPVDNVTAGPMFWPIDQTEKMMGWYRRWLPEAPEDVYAFFLTAMVPGDPFPPELHGKKVCGLLWSIIGSPEEAKSFLQTARDVEEPVFEHIDAMPYPALQAMFDGLYPPGDQWYWKGDFVHELTDEAIAEHIRFSENVPTPKSCMHLYPINGAVHNVAENETAWSKRNANWSMVIVGVDSDPKSKDIMTKWAREYWEAVHPYNRGGAYINFMMEEGDDRIRATYGENYDRLVEIKTKYDPDNLFRVNQNIKPMNDREYN